jgi:site-specific DNA-cytosine methylase
LSGRSMETERGTRVLQEPGGGQVAVAFAENQQGELREMSVTGQISRGGGKPGQGYQAVIPPTERPRRLTPLECSRLQGFPDDYLLPASDTQWYRAMGNAVTMPVVRWILARLYALR